MTDLRVQTILYKMLPLVAEQGWTTAALRQAAAGAQETPQAVKRLFPDGIRSAISAWQRLLDDQMVQRVQVQGFKSERIRDRVAQAVWARLELIGEHREAYDQAVRQRVFHPRPVLNDLWQTADAIWNLAGDTATDYNHYTKRVLLAQLVFKTTLSYLGDTSDSFSDTRAYLDRQIDGIVARGQMLNRAKPVFDAIWSVAQKAGVHAAAAR